MAGGNVNFTGKYKCYKNDNFEEYMKATGLCFHLTIMHILRGGGGREMLTNIITSTARDQPEGASES